MNPEIIIIYLTAFITTVSMASLGFVVYSYINKKRIMRKYLNDNMI